MSGSHLALLGMSFGGGPPEVIGEPYGGGFYAGQISTSANSVATHYLIVAPKSSGQSGPGIQWKTSDTSTSGTSSVIDGPTNTANMNNASHPAAQFCSNLTIGTYSDWYMGAMAEQEVCYYNLKPSTTNNDTTTGSNAYSVPARPSNYTTGNPAQTSATDFQSGSAEAFNTANYWNSTEYGPTAGRLQSFSIGFQGNAGKISTFLYVRAIRRIPV